LTAFSALTEREFLTYVSKNDIWTKMYFKWLGIETKGI